MKGMTTMHLIFCRRRWRKSTTATVESRVRKALRAEGQVLRKPRSERERAELGDYFTADAHTGTPDRRHCDLEQLAREYRVLYEHETIAE
jgi:hypothetical protein